MRSTFLTWNVKYSRKVSSDPKYEKLGWENRKQFILPLLDTDIICLQEVHHTYLKDLEPLEENYFVMRSKMNSVRDGETFLITMAKREIFRLKEHMTIDFSHCVDEKGKIGEVCDFSLLEYHDDESSLAIYNIHFPTSTQLRLDTAKAFTLIYPIPSILCGDFNSFASDRGFEQINILKSKGLCDASPLINLEKPGELVHETFNSYPTDTYLPPEDRIRFPLDHIMCSQILFKNPTCYINDQVEYEGKRYGASDHYPLFFTFRSTF